MTIRAVLLSLSIGVCGCGSDGSYELRWTIGCDQAAACEVKRVKDCSQYGLDSVEVLARTAGAAGDEDRSTFSCFSPDEGAVGRGPGLPGGAMDLLVYGLSASGLRLTDPVTISAQIPDEGLVSVQVEIPHPPQCRDGVDNDLDGLVDLFDPDCLDGNDADEGS